jgi:hypothetical protein
MVRSVAMGGTSNPLVVVCNEASLFVHPRKAPEEDTTLGLAQADASGRDRLCRERRWIASIPSARRTSHYDDEVLQSA